ncbi:MAG: transporter [Pseudolabrys sp.]
MSLIAAMLLALAPRVASADENGVSFWLPGLFGSLAAAPGVPGWAFTMLYYHTSVSAGAGAAFPRGGRVDLGIDGRGDITVFGPTYIFATPVLGAQASMSMLAIAGRNQASASATLTGPLGNTISGSRTDTLAAFGDLVPQFALKWNQGVNNYMAYVTGDIPVGNYDPNRLANLGIGHGAFDGGFGYTYLNPQTGHEFSITTGLTYNFENPDTNYQNGIDWHVDWGLSQFLTKQFLIGLVGYYYQQITDDSGSGAVLGGFRSRVAGIGPQIGYIFPMDEMQGYLNLKAYKEFAAENRPEGWNVWLTFAITTAPPTSASPSRLITKAR